MTGSDRTASFERERPRLLRIAGRILHDHTEAQDIVQQAWLRLNSTDAAIESLPAWLTTVTTRLCLDRLRAPVALDIDRIELSSHAPDPAADLELADTVGIALQVVLDRLTPQERVAFVLHDSFSIVDELVMRIDLRADPQSSEPTGIVRAELGERRRREPGMAQPDTEPAGGFVL